MELALTILSLIIGVLALPAIYKSIESWLRRVRSQKWSADLQVERAYIARRKDYAFEDWHQEVRVDGNGSVVHCVTAHVVNISPHLLQTLAFPIYGDNVDVPDTVVQPWAKAGRRSLDARVIDWNPDKCRGRVTIDINPPLAPSERRKIMWGYSLPNIFRAGDEYYQWDISPPHYLISGVILFDPVWRIHNPGWTCDEHNRLPPPKLIGNRIKWHIRFPKVQERYRMGFGLSRRV